MGGVDFYQLYFFALVLVISNQLVPNQYYKLMDWSVFTLDK